MTQLFELARVRQPAIGSPPSIARSPVSGMPASSPRSTSGAECAVYEPTAPPHAHFRCTGCGRISDVAYTIADDVSAQLASANGFAIENEVKLRSHGHCGACSA